MGYGNPALDILLAFPDACDGVKDGGHGEEADEDRAVDDCRRILGRVGGGPDEGV